MIIYSQTSGRLAMKIKTSLLCANLLVGLDGLDVLMGVHGVDTSLGEGDAAMFDRGSGQ